MGEIHHLLLQLFVIFVAAQLGAEIAQRLRIPSVVGEIAAGVAVGPSALGWIPLEGGHAPMPFEVLAEVGVVFLMFSVGLETKLSSLRHLGKTATQVAVLGVIIPFGLGLAWAAWQGYPFAKQAFIGTAFVATSVAITARVLADLGALQREESKVILAAAVLDDILAMLLLGAVSAFQPAAGAEPAGSPAMKLLILGLQAAAFLYALMYVLPLVMKKHHRIIEAPISPHSPFVFAVTLCIGCAVLANQIGLAAIIGAFLAGTLFADVGEKYGLEKQFHPLLTFLAPFFFVVTGTKVELAVFGDWGLVGTVVLVTTLAILGKVIGCGVGSWKMGRRSALTIGVGMTPRGEVGIIIAALGLSHGVFTNEIYAVIIAMALLTSLFAPPVLSRLLRRTAT